MIEKVHKFLGVGEYDEPQNTSRGDSYFLKSIYDEYGVEKVDACIEKEKRK